MNRRSEKIMRMIDDITIGKSSSGLLYPVTTDKPSRVGLSRDGVRKKALIDYCVISARLKQSVISPAIVHDEIGAVSDHFPIVLSFKST